MKKLIISILVLFIVSCATTQPVLQSRKAQKTPTALKPYNVIIDKLEAIEKDYEKLVIKYQQQEIKNVELELEIKDLQRQIDSLKSLHVVETPQELKAFYNSKGAGKIATGGRGGKVIHVTNLNARGQGSFKEAMETKGARIIVFDVSGTIVLDDEIELTEDYSDFTVAGQTAPRGGITITNDFIRLGGGWSDPQSTCNNGVFRYIRFRNARYDGTSDNPKHNGVISKGTVGLIFDHCSFSFNDDQALGMAGAYGDLTDITIQNCIFSENATGIIAGYSYNTKQGRMSFINNLFVDLSHRTPNIGGNLQFDVINNVMFNWKWRLSTANVRNSKINYIGNYLKEGSYTEQGTANQVQNVTPSIYSNGNKYIPFSSTPKLNDRTIWQKFVNAGNVSDNLFIDNEHPILGGFEYIEVDDVFNVVLSDVGANKYLNSDGSYGIYLDSYDTDKINNTLNNISSNPLNKNWVLPVLPSNVRPSNYDTDRDGMSDEWERKEFGDLSKTADGDEDNDGYTNIEEFLNNIDK